MPMKKAPPAASPAYVAALDGRANWIASFTKR
jgi:hypothetical protein